MEEIRFELVRLATEELWAKMCDMQAGTDTLSAAEWGLALARLSAEIERLGRAGETAPSSTEGSY